MKIIRSVKCSIKAATKSKLDILDLIRTEYSRITNLYINIFWSATPKKSQLLKATLNKVGDSWLSQRMKQQAAREAVDMIIASKKKE